MSIYRLGSDALEKILCFLDAKDTARLYLSGDKVLSSRLKPAIRDFWLTVETTTPPSLSSLLSLFKESSSRPRSFSLSLGLYYAYLRFVDEEHTAEKWKSFFPENLETLDLALRCNETPFTSLMRSLAEVAPRLNTLRIWTTPEGLTLPQTLKILEIGVPPPHWVSKSIAEPSILIQSLPTTLTHLKFYATTPDWYYSIETDLAELPFRNMPLTLFHCNLKFASFDREQACWSILPNTITDLRAELSYGPKKENFEFPKNRTWAQLFPNLTSLNVPVESLAEAALLADSSTVLDGEILEKQIETIRSSFPASLKTLYLPSPSYFVYYNGLPLLACALGDRISSLNFEYHAPTPKVLKWLPKWENPQVDFMQIPQHLMDNLEQGPIGEENGEKKKIDKDHPISDLYCGATYLQPGMLPASAISLLPRTIRVLDFAVSKKNPISMVSASKASVRMRSNDNNIDTDVVNLELNPKLGWTLLSWPPGLTKLAINFCEDQPLHLSCLPATLTELDIMPWESVNLALEGGDLAHMSELSTLWLNPTTWPLLATLNGLPRSLQSFTARRGSISTQAFVNPGLEKNFFDLQILNLLEISHSADILLYLPRTLKELRVTISREGPSLSEKHFEQISRTKLAHLVLEGSALWPSDLNFDVYSRFMPKSLAIMQLNLDYLENKFFLQETAKYLPITLLEFYSDYSVLRDMARMDIRYYNLSRAYSS